MNKELQIIVNKIYNLEENKIKDIKHLCNLYRKWNKLRGCYVPKLKIINLKDHGFDKQYLYVAHDMDYDGHNVVSAYDFMKLVIANIQNAFKTSPQETIEFWRKI